MCLEIDLQLDNPGAVDREIKARHTSAKLLPSRSSEVLAVKQGVGAFEDGESGEAGLVLLANIAHIEQLLVMEDEELSLPVKISGSANRCERPPDEFLQHEHASHAGDETESSSVASSANVYIVAILTLRNVHPVLLDWRLVVVDLTVQDVLGEETHTEVDHGLVLSWDTAMVLVKLLEIVGGLCIGLCSHNQRHCSSFIAY